MLIDFNAIRETVVSGMNDGEGVVGARMQVNDSGRFVLTASRQARVSACMSRGRAMTSTT